MNYVTVARSGLLFMAFIAAACLDANPCVAQGATYTYTLLQYAYAYDEYAAPPIQALDGKIYDVGQDQNTDGGLTFNFSLPPAPAVNLYVYTFGGNPADGELPVGGLVQGPDGALYGTAGLGGDNACGCGVIYKIAGSFSAPGAVGTETPLYSFLGGDDGGYPQGTLIFDSGGLMYGTTPDGGSTGAGALFSYNQTTNTLTPLYQFCVQTNCTDGAAPYWGVVQGTDTKLYGATRNGGGASGNDGVVYSVSTSGDNYTVVHAFCTSNASPCPDGSNPTGPLVEYSDGNFYGLTVGGGVYGNGTFYRVTPSGGFTTLYNFTGVADGGTPVGSLFVGSDGNFYGVTQQGGFGGWGTVFQLTPTGTLTTLYAFTYLNHDGVPYNGVVQASDGNFYGMVSGFYDDYGGYPYEIAPWPALAPPVQLALGAYTVTPNTPVTLNWQVSNAFSLTLQNCIAFVQGNPAGAGTWAGPQAGTYSGTTKLFTGSAVVTPTANGTYTYALSCGGQESGFATLTVGTTPPNAAASATSISFGPQPVGTSSAARPITITNTGSESLTIGAVSLSGANPASFRTSNTCSSPLAAGGKCTVNVSFVPPSTGARAAVVNVANNGAGGALKIALSGTAAAPTAGLTVNPASLNFGSQVVEFTSAPQIITVTNTTTAPVSVTSVRLVGANVPSFVTSNSCGVTLAVEGSCTISVSFEPRAVASLSASISIVSGAASGLASVGLSGMGLAPTRALTVSPSSLNFGLQAVGISSGELVATITNTTGAAATVTAVSFGGANEPSFGAITYCGALAVGASCTVTAVFVPSSPGAKSAHLNFVSSGGTSPAPLGLTGTGVTPTRSLTLSATSLNFGDQASGTSSAAQVLTLTNNTAAAVTLYSVGLTGANVPSFATTNTCGPPLAIEASCTISVTFNPASAGAKSAAVTIVDSGVPSRVTVTLSGTGT
jgi:uncharacterized repeat protein (TIGR03803 family)